MTDAMKFDATTVTPIPDPTTESGEIFLFEDALGQNGRPFVFMVEDPPNKTRARHYHHEDVLYVYVSGEHDIEGEGTYRAGDLRWTRAGHVYGPETTGAQGGSWWVISYGDPIPVDVAETAADTTGASETPSVPAQQLPRFASPYDWDGIDRAVRTIGGAILEQLLPEAEIDRLDVELDAYLGAHADAAAPSTGSQLYDLFLGHRTLRLHGLLEKIPGSANLIGRPELVAWAQRLIGPMASSVLLNAAELIQIEPGEPAQFLHRDTDSWPQMPVGEHPVLVNALVALDPFTLDNGATCIATESWRWDANRQPRGDELARAVMNRGDAVLFRGDLVHGGGENASGTRRRALSVSYCAGWLRPVENSFLNLSRVTVRALTPQLQALVGFAHHDASSSRGGMVGLFENGDPARALTGETGG